MNRDTMIAEIEEVIDILKAEIIKDDSFIKVYDSLLATYENAQNKIMKNPDYKCEDLVGMTNKYVTKVKEENASKDLVEALWKVESLIKVMYRQ
ncbi:MAG: hypothetical protein E7254_09025 [Lachnospiraceae bacterium]|nr:hypothetical protein [Lachnospiraceae bacterium]